MRLFLAVALVQPLLSVAEVQANSETGFLPRYHLDQWHQQELWGSEQPSSAGIEVVEGRLSSPGKTLPSNIRAVAYAPHLIGEAHKQGDVYSTVYRRLHQRDLTLIKNTLQANTILIRPWKNHDAEAHAAFIQIVNDIGLQVIATFSMSSWYTLGEIDSSMYEDFRSFTTSLSGFGDNLIGWTVDASLSIQRVWPPPGAGVCGDISQLKQMHDFGWYSKLLSGIMALRADWKTFTPPFLMPLDLDTSPTSQVSKQFVKCASAEAGPHGWGIASSADMWLFAMSLPLKTDPKMEMEMFVTEYFTDRLSGPLMAAGKQAPVVMIGAGGVKVDPNNSIRLIEEYVTADAPSVQQETLKEAWKQAKKQLAGKEMAGVVIDEWTDDWDRGRYGVFMIADGSEQERECGARYYHDATQRKESCLKQLANPPPQPIAGPAVEYFGLTSQFTIGVRHCVVPRFGGDKGFSFDSSAAFDHAAYCDIMEPAIVWLICAGAVLLACLLCSLFALGLTWRRKSTPNRSSRPQRSQRAELLNQEEAPGTERAGPGTGNTNGNPESINRSLVAASFRVDGSESSGQSVPDSFTSSAHITAESQVISGFDESFRIRLESKNRGLHPQALQVLLGSHAHVQSSRLDRQLASEVSAMEALHPESEDNISRAMEAIHARVLEGFVCLVEDKGRPQAAAFITANRGRCLKEMYTEAFLFRLMESLAEHIANAPERVQHLYGRTMQAKESAHGSSYGSCHGATYVVNYDELQDGLAQMQQNSNPFSGGITFDDINDSGKRGFSKVRKTFREPSGLLVLLDWFLCHRGLIGLKGLAFVLAIYLYLGSGIGDGEALATTNNGSFFNPEWARFDMLQYCALADACVWTVTLVIGASYRAYQNMGCISTHVIGLLLQLVFTVAGGIAMFSSLDVCDKPSKYVPDTRSSSPALIGAAYLLLRFVGIFISHHRRVPMFIQGTPSFGKALNARSRWKKDLRAALTWFVVLIPCVAFEAYLLLPITSGLDWQQQCGLDPNNIGFWKPDFHGSSHDGGGPCQDRLLRADCGSCIMSISILWLLVFLCGWCLDFYFFFYFISGIGGFVAGCRRGINNLKNPRRTVDLRPITTSEPDSPCGQEAALMQSVFGSGWRKVWARIVESLFDEDLICSEHADDLVVAAGMERGSWRLSPNHRLGELDRVAESHTSGSPMHGPAIDLNALPESAAERLATFFGSLPGILGRGGRQSALGGVGHRRHPFDPQRDALSDCHVGTVPSLSQIIPVYNEAVIPTSKYLKAGSERRHAANQRNPATDYKSLPPLGDGLNSNLGFLISMYVREWVFLAARLHSTSAQELFNSFMSGRLTIEQEMEVRMWAAMRTQSVAKTALGALQYHRCLRELPNFVDYYASHASEPCGSAVKVPSDHVELLLSHQTYGSRHGVVDNDDSVNFLLRRYSEDPIYLIFDYDADHSNPEIVGMVEGFLIGQFGDVYPAGSLHRASCKAMWDSDANKIKLVQVLPRLYPLRIGSSKEYLSQGKASNQLSALRFATGHCLQAMDANMGIFSGEAFKMPFVMRRFHVSGDDRNSRKVVLSRYIGFRERIFTSEEGAVGRCHASAEWTFGTTYQRFLSVLGVRMHYGHPDFLDAFWASNRGGMSKASPVLNLSEDIFAGFNCKVREERCTHVDYLEFLKGRETTLTASSQFFFKIAGGSVGVMRSRDLQMICEKIGVLHSLPFYFASTGFYVSNLVVDWTIYLYVLLFISFTLASQSIAALTDLGSTLSTEWILAMGLVSAFPQLLELILEYGTGSGLKRFLSEVIDTMIFFMFQNKTIASAIKTGAITGKAKYFWTGRPLANQHSTWRDNYIFYCHSHYYPAVNLIGLLVVYHLLTGLNGEGTLPMVLVATSAVIWLVAPVLFSPFPTWRLLCQDLKSFVDYVLSPAAAEDGRKVKLEDSRSLHEWALVRCLHENQETSWQAKGIFFVNSLLMCLILLCVMPANIQDYLWVFMFVFGLRWILTLGSLTVTSNNLLTFLAFAVWALVPFIASPMIGLRGGAGYIEYFLCLFVFLAVLNAAKRAVLFVGCIAPSHQDALARFAYYFFMESDIDVLVAMVILVLHTLVSMVLMIFECACMPCGLGLHSWWLLNGHVARAAAQRRAYEPGRTAPVPTAHSGSGFGGLRTNSSWLLERLGRRPGQSWSRA